MKRAGTEARPLHQSINARKRAIAPTVTPAKAGVTVGLMFLDELGS